jgi:hypothetical protein
LETQVQELQDALAAKHPDSLSALLRAAQPPLAESRAVAKLTARVHALETASVAADEAHTRTLRSLRQRHDEVKQMFDARVAKLAAKLARYEPSSASSLSLSSSSSSSSSSSTVVSGGGGSAVILTRVQELERELSDARGHFRRRARQAEERELLLTRQLQKLQRGNTGAIAAAASTSVHSSAKSSSKASSPSSSSSSSSSSSLSSSSLSSAEAPSTPTNAAALTADAATPPPEARAAPVPAAHPAAERPMAKTTTTTTTPPPAEAPLPASHPLLERAHNTSTSTLMSSSTSASHPRSLRFGDGGADADADASTTTTTTTATMAAASVASTAFATTGASSGEMAALRTQLSVVTSQLSAARGEASNAAAAHHATAVKAQHAIDELTTQLAAVQSRCVEVEFALRRAQQGPQQRQYTQLLTQVQRLEDAHKERDAVLAAAASERREVIAAERRHARAQFESMARDKDGVIASARAELDALMQALQQLQQQEKRGGRATTKNTSKSGAKTASQLLAASSSSAAETKQPSAAEFETPVKVKAPPAAYRPVVDTALYSELMLDSNILLLGGGVAKPGSARLDAPFAVHADSTLEVVEVEL